MEKGFPRWVEDELWNWSRWCWMGEWPHPMPPSICGSVERGYLSPREKDDEDQEQEARIPVNVDRARQVQKLYDALPLIEQRVVQAEYTRRHEYGDKSAAERMTAACLTLKVRPEYYRIALGYAKEQVRRAFQ